MLDKRRVTDGFTSLEGGMDAGSATNLIPRNKVAFAMNATFRTGYLNNRPGWASIPLSFLDDETRTAYTTGQFQGAGWYIPVTGNPFVFVSISGHIYRLTPGATSFTVEDLTPSGDPNVSFLPKVWMCQADSFLVIQDGLDAPFVYDGTTLRRSTCILPDDPSTSGKPPYLQPANKEVPTGTAMAYGYGRLWLVRGKNVEAGDILNASIPNSAILFTEVLQYNDAFSVPVTSGDITAIAFGANIDTSIGQGPLQVHTASGQVITLDVTVERTTWTQTNIQNIGLMGGAATGQECVVNVNNDTWFRSNDGIRSFVVARRQFNTWGNTSQSREVDPILKYDTPNLLIYASGVWFNNRLLLTISPQLAGKNRYFQGLVALDYDLTSTLSGTLNGTNPEPAYDGIWTGINVTQITKTYFGSEERCFIFTWDATLGNQLWELSKEAPFDNGSCPIVSWIETGSYNSNSLTNLKKLIGADLWIDQLQETVQFDVSWQPDQFPFWQPWQSFEESDGNPCSTTQKRNAFLSCEIPVQSPPQYRSRIRLQEPESTIDNPEGEYPINFGYDFRFRIQWKGRARIKGFRVFGYIQEDETTGSKP